MAFADSLLDKLDVWNGKLRLEQIEIIDPALLRGQLRGERGQCWWARTWATSKCAARWRRSASRSP
jgi:predicted LPLAT superfamily acyltransferase